MSGARMVIAGGGTGGHLMPGLAVAEVLRRQGADVTFIGTARGLEAQLVPAAGYRLDLITIGGLKSGSALRRAANLARLPLAVSESARLLRRLRPGAVLGIGGYASGPVLAAAGLLRIPAVALEVNAKTGMANRWAAPWLAAAAVNFPETARDFKQAVVTGVPVRAGFAARSAATERAGPPWVLVTGGSQGAHGLNLMVQAMGAALRPGDGFRLRHQTGPRDHAAIATAYAATGGQAVAEAFVDDMAAAMAEASLLVSRSGASTLGELAAAGRAAILVPLPTSADQHQLHNARARAEAGAAVVIEQKDLTPAGLRRQIEQLLADGARLRAMENAAAGLARPDAAEHIAELVLAHAKK